MNRRGFLGAILAVGVAPAIVRASSIESPTLEYLLRHQESSPGEPLVVFKPRAVGMSTMCAGHLRIPTRKRSFT
jgi:hypothetical protein